jgi:pyridoxine 4-dehydrogenase
MSQTTTHSPLPAEGSDLFSLDELKVHRLGYGTMQLTGPGVWGYPSDRGSALRVLKRALELGVDLIDTADAYGPYVCEELIAEALHPYPKGLLIATKAGLTRTGPGQWHPVGRPEYLRQECEMSLRRLKLERIDLFQLHRIDPQVPADEQFGVLKDLQAEGKVRHVGLSEVSVPEIKAARRIVPIATVQNLYNLKVRTAEPVLDYCEREQIGFIPWFPIASGELVEPGGAIAEMAKETGATATQLSLAWLLHRSPVMLPIPGTSSLEHLEENCAAAKVQLSDAQVAKLNRLHSPRA